MDWGLFQPWRAAEGTHFSPNDLKKKDSLQQLTSGTNAHAFISSVNQSVNCHNTAAFRGMNSLYTPAQIFVFKSIMTHISLSLMQKTNESCKWTDLLFKCPGELFAVINQEVVDFKSQSRPINTDLQDSEHKHRSPEARPSRRQLMLFLI